MELPYTFEPLFAFLEQLDMTLDDLITQEILSKPTAEKIKNSQPVMLSTAATLCISLGCNMSDIVALNYAYEPPELAEFTEPPGVGEAKKTAETERLGYNAWTKEEEDQLIEEYNCGENLVMIARKHKRTRGAISARINRLKDEGRLISIVNKTDTVRSIAQDVPSAPGDVISISELARRLTEKTHRKLKYEDIASWLVFVGDFEEYIDDGKKLRIPTEQGEDHGIKRGKRKNPVGMEYVGVYLEPTGQNYIREKLGEIFAFMDKA